MVGSGVYIGLSLELTTDQYFLEPSEDQRNKSIIYNRHSPMIPNIINPYGIYNYSAIIDTIVYPKIVLFGINSDLFSSSFLSLHLFPKSSSSYTHRTNHAQRSLMDSRVHQPQQPTTQGPFHNKSYGGTYHEPFSTPGKTSDLNNKATTRNYLNTIV